MGGGSRRSVEAIAMIHVRDGLSQGSRGGNDAMASDSGYILKIWPVGFGKGGQDVRERKKYRLLKRF